MVTTSETAGEPEPVTKRRPSWWVRLIAALPWCVLYAFADFAAWLAWRVFPYRQHVVRENLTKAFPDLDEAALSKLMRDYYRSYAWVAVEIVKAARMTADDFRRRVRIVGFEKPRAFLDAGTPVLLVSAHHGNWEWVQLAVSAEAGYPVDAAYKPLVNAWAEREMLALRTQFGSRLVPACDLLPHIIKGGRRARIIALVADQEPRDSEHKHWTRFLNRDTAFFLGPEQIARATRFPVFFAGLRRLSRGYYELTFTPLAEPGEQFAPGELTERYVRMVEEQVRASPADFPWSHKRWKLKRPLYGKRC